MADKREETKLCRGFFHAPGTMLPLSEFYTHKRGPRVGKPLSLCKRCKLHARKNPKGDNNWNAYVDIPWDVIEELRRRIGPIEAARRAGLERDVLTPYRLERLSKGMRQTTADSLVRALDEARANGEDNHDPNEVRRAHLIPGGPPGAREAAVAAMQRKWKLWRALRAAEKRKRRKLTPEEMAMNRMLHMRQQVKPDNHDPYWWHHTGQEWLPRWGEEMLGRDF